MKLLAGSESPIFNIKTISGLSPLAQLSAFSSESRKRKFLSLSKFLFLVMLLLLPTPSQAESWGDMFKSMTKEVIEEGKQKILKDDNDKGGHAPAETEQHGQTASGQFEQSGPPATGNNLGAHQIKRVQRDLQRLGYDPGPADGVMGQKTSQAIKQFERDTNLPVTGLPSPRVLAGMASALQTSPTQSGKVQLYTPAQLNQMTTPEGEFATAKSDGECAVAYVKCGKVSQHAYCAKQSKLCADRFKVALSDGQIEQEVQAVLSQCGAQSTSQLYDCQCKADAYRSYRHANRMVAEHYNNDDPHYYDTKFYDTDWAPRCYKPEGAYQYEYSSCMHMLPMHSSARNLTRAQIEARCRCQAEELSRLQGAATEISSTEMQEFKYQAARRCQ